MSPRSHALAGPAAPPIASALLALALTVLAATPAEAARAAPDTFPLGVSSPSGAVCEAVRDDDDPGAQMRGARAWDIRCRGWDATLGKLYAYSWRGPTAVAAKGLWSETLAAHADCRAPTAAKIKAVPDARLASCQAFSAHVPYLALSGVLGGRGVAAEGFASLADVLETGLGVVAGTTRPPSAIQSLSDTLATPTEDTAAGLAQTTQAAAAAPENLRERGYSRNLAWRFAEAETDFSALAQNAAAPTQTRADAYLNWALNTSNLGRFNRAGALFDEAKPFIGADAALQGEYLSYRALDLRNQKQFKAAIETAERARRVFLSLEPTADAHGDQPALTRDAGGDLVIGPRMASALESRTAFAIATLDPGARVRVQVAETYLTQATAEGALGDAAGERRDLLHASALLADPGVAQAAIWLHAQVDAELARQDEIQGRNAEAAVRLRFALQRLRQREAGSSAEAYLLMELASAETRVGDQADALRDFEQGIVIFKASRGSLGASADSADSYLRLLLERIAKDPARRDVYADRFLAAAESLGSEATADTVARLSARLDATNSTAAGLIRGLEDTRRQLRLAQAEIAQFQAQGGYTPAVRASKEEEVKSLTAQAQTLEQKVAVADPRYGQLVTTEVSLKALQAKLRPGEVFVKIVLLDQGGYGIAIGQTWAEPYRIDMSRAAAEDAVTRLRKPFEARGYLPAYNVAASYDFFQAMFGPVRDRMLGATHVIYEPDPAILSLPIAALATDAKSVDLIAARRAAIRAKGEGVLSYDGVDWLGRTAQTSLVVSAVSFVQARDQPPSTARNPFLGFGDSVQAQPSDSHAFDSVVHRGGDQSSLVDDEVCRATRTALLDLAPLKEASEELSSVGASLDAGPRSDVTGAAFSDGEIVQRGDLDQYRVVYFATHGLLPEPGGCLPEPSLLTSVDDAIAGSDGLLTASKILGLKLNADLVVLSACDTGGGVTGELDRTGLGGAGESLSGLTRAFIYAGARSLLVSQWQIDSHATVRLMTTLFRTKAATLGGGMMAAMNTLMTSDQYSHPYYWAAFTIVGDAARPMPVG